MGDHADAAAAAGRLVEDGVPVVAAATPADVPPPDPGDLLVVDEWTAETAPHVVAARRGGARVTVLAELVLRRFDGRVLAVTGTAGKTTVCHLVASVLRAAGAHVVMASGVRADNAWPNHSLVGVRGGDDAWLVAELTSTHLCHMDGWPGAEVGLLTNLWPDHIELHGSVERYVAAKARLLERSRVIVTPDGVNPSDRTPDLTFGPARPSGAGVWVDEDVIRAVTVDGDEVVIGAWDRRPRWAHPDAVLAACAAAVACGVDPESVMTGLASAPAPPHRMAEISQAGGIVRIDDSMSATPTKTASALRACPAGRIILVTGGMNRIGGVAVHDSTDERAALAETVALAGRVARAVVPFGPAGRVFARLECATPPEDDIAGAVARALDLAREGDTVLVSPMFPVDQAVRDAVPELLRGRDGV